MKNVTVSMGKPITAPVLVPVEHKSTPICINDPFMVDGVCYKVTAMSFGTAHGAVFVEDVDSVDVATVGEALGTHKLFPQGASIVFVQMAEGNPKPTIKARVWQYGEGEVLFTPESACVAGTAAMMLQKTLFGEVEVSMGSHTLMVKKERNDGEILLEFGRYKLLKAGENPENPIVMATSGEKDFFDYGMLIAV
ncbi:MAG: hypothetical protein FWG83_06385 [Oscillospiraceae bacterium]|nr:hypothetical protein [Oscillospiraceae bacterium]